MLNKALMINVITLVIVIVSHKKAISQVNLEIPSVYILNNSIDIHYNKINDINSKELKLSKKYRWLNYLPTPSYYPNAGGFGLSVNFLAPLQEYRLNAQANAKLNTLHFNANLEKLLLKESCKADLNAIYLAMEQYKKGNEVDSLTMIEEKIYTEKYKKNEIPPTEYLTLKKASLAYYINRFLESENITKAIYQLYLKAKMDVPLRTPILIKLPKN